MNYFHEMDNDFNEAMNAPAVVKESGRVYDESVSMWLYEKLGCFYFLVKCGDREKGRFAFSCVSEASMSQFDHPFDINRIGFFLLISAFRLSYNLIQLITLN